MSQIFQIHPKNPQPYLIKQVAELLQAGGIVVYPTDSTYALGCRLNDKAALTRIRQIRRLSEKHNMTLMCRDLSEIATYAKVDNSMYRLLKSLTPGPYTFLLPATKEVPRRLQHPKRKSIGIRVPGNAIVRALLTELNEPLMTTTLILPGDDYPLNDSDEIDDRLGPLVDLIIDGGACGLETTSVLDLCVDPPDVIRIGKGDVSGFIWA